MNCERASTFFAEDESIGRRPFLCCIFLLPFHDGHGLCSTRFSPSRFFRTPDCMARRRVYRIRGEWQRRRREGRRGTWETSEEAPSRMGMKVPD
ncbi:hypothetical protein PMAYCL1PPCAC_07858, partial [Pristionchus mayeri]